MSAKIEEVIEGGALRPSGDVDESQDAILEIVKHIASTALGRSDILII